MIVPTVALGPIVPLMPKTEYYTFEHCCSRIPILPLWPLCHDNLVIRPEEYLIKADYGLGGACPRGRDDAGDDAPRSDEVVIFES